MYVYIYIYTYTYIYIYIVLPQAASGSVPSSLRTKDKCQGGARACGRGRMSARVHVHGGDDGTDPPQRNALLHQLLRERLQQPLDERIDLRSARDPFPSPHLRAIIGG